MPNIGVRAGHEGAITGSKGTSGNGLVERVMNRDVVDVLIKRLKKHGFNVYITTGDLGSKLYSYYNKYLTSNDLLFPVHHNGYIPTAKGSEVLISIKAKYKAKRHAQMLLNLFVKTFGTTSRGIVQRESEANPGYDYYGIIKNTKPKVILGEPLFLTNKNDAEIVKANYNKFIEREAECYLQVACSWYGLTYKPLDSVEPKPTDNEIEVLKNQIQTNTNRLDEYLKRIKNLEAKQEKIFEELIALQNNQIERTEIERPENYEKVLKLIKAIENY